MIWREKVFECTACYKIIYINILFVYFLFNFDELLLLVYFNNSEIK